MLWDRLEILLMPRLILFRRKSMTRRREDGLRTRAQPVQQAENGADWHGAATALAAVLRSEGRRGTRVEVILSDLWVRSHLVPAAPTSLDENEVALLARAHFSRQYPETGQDSWAFRLARQGSHLLAAGMESELLRAIRETSASAGAQLSRMEPLFGWVHDQFEKALAGTTGWMLLEEPGMLTLAFLDRGTLTSLHCQRCEDDRGEAAARLLERQSALLAQPSAEVRYFSIGSRPAPLPAPWRIVSHERIFGFDGHDANLNPAGEPLAGQR